VLSGLLVFLGICAIRRWSTTSEALAGLGLGATVGALVFSVAVFAWSLGEGLLARENVHRLFDVLDEIAAGQYVKKALTDEERKAVADARKEDDATLDVRSSYTKPGKGKHERLVVLGDGDIWYVTHAGGPGSAGNPPTAKRR
jgi:multisubunit Na+/H+ antiporter MnhG subunit